MPLDFLDNEEIAESLGPNRIQWSGDSLSAEPVPPVIKRKVTMKAWRASTQVVVGQQKISGEGLLTMVANKLGPSHFAPESPPELAAMAPFSLAGVSSLYLTLARLGDVVVHVGPGEGKAAARKVAALKGEGINVFEYALLQEHGGVFHEDGRRYPPRSFARRAEEEAESEISAILERELG